MEGKSPRWHHVNAAALHLDAMHERDGKAAILATATRMMRHVGESAFEAIGDTIKGKGGKEERMANARQTHDKRMANAWQRTL